MNRAEHILSRARELGFTLHLDGQELCIGGGGEIPPRLITAIAENREALIALLKEASLDHLAPLPDQDAPDLVADLADKCTVFDCGAECETYTPDGLPLCAKHSPMDIGRSLTLRQQHFVQERDKWRGNPGEMAKISEATWFKIQRSPAWQAIVDEVLKQGENFTGLERDWRSLVEKDETFDPSKQPDWTEHGYRRGADKRWHAPRSDYWKERSEV